MTLKISITRPFQVLYAIVTRFVSIGLCVGGILLAASVLVSYLPSCDDIETVKFIGPMILMVGKILTIIICVVAVFLGRFIHRHHEKIVDYWGL